MLNDPIQLIGPASLVGNSRETFHKSGTDGSNPVPSSGESASRGTFRARSSRWPVVIIMPFWNSSHSRMAFWQRS